jgi:hypothetical protein
MAATDLRQLAQLLLHRHRAREIRVSLKNDGSDWCILDHCASQLDELVLNGLGVAVRIPAVLNRVPDDMKLLDSRRRDFFQPIEWVKGMIPAVNEQVRDVEEQAAIRLLADRIEKIRFGQFAFYPQVRGNIFENDRPTASLRNLPGMGGNGTGHCASRLNGIEVTQVDLGSPGKGDMLADPFRPRNLNDARKAIQALVIQFARRSET